MRYKFADLLDGGDQRVVERFLLLPMVLDRELRWMERAKIRQVYVEVSYSEDVARWKNVRWED